ncbi:MAG: helix-hairpin-helix domain-containing protein, partial [Nitrospiraceae bacterium]|nr:helix-hairpin-helix domain-containing protein [Nitrospiraceae bacterium]
MPEELQGQLEHIAFYNEQNHYTVAKMKVQGRGDLVTVVGILVSVSAGEVLRMQGTWETHSRYGRQFKVISYETVAPATAEGIRRYLGSGLIKGIGPVMAKRLVDRFGTKTLDVIENDSRKLHEVEGIGTKRIEMIKQAWEEQRDVREVMLFLQGQGVSSAYAAKIYRQYGRESIRVVKENPYRLATDIFGIGFLIADKIASQLGVSKDSPLRAEAGILYALGKVSEEGHIYYPYEPLLEECHKMLDLERGVLAKAAATAAAEGKIIIENLEGPFAAPNNKAVYLAR